MASLHRFVDIEMNRNLMRRHTPGAKAPCFRAVERAKAEALGYLEVKKRPLLDLVGVGWFAGELVEEAVPGFAVLVPSAEGFDAEQGCFAEFALEGGVVGDLLHSLGESVDVAIGDDEALLAVGEEVFGTGGGGGEDGAAAGHGLALDEGEALFDAGEDEEVAGAHFFGEL